MYWYGRHAGTWACGVLYILSLGCSVSEAAVGLGKDVAKELLHMDNVTDLTISTVFIFIGYIFQYIILGSLFELSNPNGFNSKTLSVKERERRYRQVRKEISTGMASLAVTVVSTGLWMYYGEPNTPFYGFFSAGTGHVFNWKWLVGAIIAYVFWFDTWFYWSHRWLHDYDFLWNNIHFVHHQFKEPSCFAQFAVHPVESLLQGPVGHYLATLFFPMHPVPHAVMGFLSSAWAIAAHDGRWMDFNSHYYHHSKGRGRFIYFNLGFLTPFWDQLCGTRWSEFHPKWVEWKTKRGKQLFDTRTGTPDGIKNDVFEAYAEGEKNHIKLVNGNITPSNEAAKNGNDLTATTLTKKRSRKAE